MAKKESASDKQGAAEGARRYPDVSYEYRPGRIVDASLTEHTAVFTTDNNIILKITVVTPEIIRLHYALEGDFVHDFSYAVDPEFEPETASFRMDEKEDRFELETRSLLIHVTRDTLRVHFFDNEGRALCEEAEGFFRRDSLMKGIREVGISKKAPKGKQFYGLGDKAFSLNLRGKAFENWNTDSYAYERDDDPLYRSIPFYAALIEDRAYGIFFDNPFRTRFDFGKRKKKTSSFSADGGALNYYFIFGPDLQDVTRRYTRLTGTPELPPIWALGYHQSRWSYHPEAKVREIARTFREQRIPCDAIYLDIDYMDDYKVFTWDEQSFPDPKKLVDDLKKEGFQTVVMIDPGIKADHDYPVFNEGKKRDFFCKRADGDLMIGPVWPPRCVFPDFTHPEVREWWGDLYDDFMNDIKVGGVWNDMNEPALFEVESKTFPDDVRHDYDGHPCSHKKAHNIYGMQMARASLDGIKKHAPHKRPFLLTRAGFSGGQRYAALWTGDNIATWDHLKLANEQCQRLSISGYSFCGSDIGGFVKQPGPELFIRWLQLGVFHPLFRTHSMGYNVDGAAAVRKEEVEQKKAEHTDLAQEPWSFGEEATDISRKTIELRYRLLSYLYTAFRNYVEEQVPVLKPLVFFDQSDPNAPGHDDEFLFGDHLLVAPVLEKGKTSRKVYLPEGSWYHYWDDERMAGSTSHKIGAPLERIPFFVKAGTVLPLRETMQYTGEKRPNLLALNVYHGEGTNRSRLYEDAEEGYEYRNGEFRLTTFEYVYDAESGKIILSASREGSYRPEYENFEVVFIGLPEPVKTCTVDGEQVEHKGIERNGKTAFQLSASPDVKKIVLSLTS